MTLTELKYIVAVARERHFGRAAEACFVSQPTLSVAIKKLEDELGVQLFERGSTEVSITPIGEQVVEQAQRVLEESSAIKEIARQGKDPLLGPLRVGVIHTIGPYLLPALVPRMIEIAPRMPLLLQENLTVKLLEMLRLGDIDVAILAEPFPEHAFVTQAAYDEPFVVAVSKGHPWSRRKQVKSTELKEETMLLLGAGHCFRDQVLEVCPELSRYSQASAGIQKTFEGSSLETIRHMVASGIGVTVLPWTAMPGGVLSHDNDIDDGDRNGIGNDNGNRPRTGEESLLRYLPFVAPPPTRRVVLAWRKSFTRTAALAVLRNAMLEIGLPGVTTLPDERPVAH